MALEVLPATRAEAWALGARRYFTGEPCPQGHISVRRAANGVCMVCERAYKQTPLVKARNLEWALRSAKENPSRVKLNKARWREGHQHVIRRWISENPERNAELKREGAKRYAKKHPAKRTAIQSERRVRKMRAMPKWADRSAINEFYENRPQGMTVDHIIPLKHPLVCGLHVLNNLQYLTASQNAAKHNKFNPEDFS